MTKVKICGIKTEDALAAACEAGAQFVGFVFYPTSSRYVEPDQAYQLIKKMPSNVQSVGLFVNPTDRDLETILGLVPVDMVQLHGDETAQRMEEVKLKTELPVIKALPISTAQDVAKVADYEDAADWLLFDAKAPAGQYGGTGQSFDWGLLSGQTFKKPWMLSGGLSAENIKDALKNLSPNAVDVSSGVERERGVKDPTKIKAFIDAVKAL